MVISAIFDLPLRRISANYSKNWLNAQPNSNDDLKFVPVHRVILQINR